MRKNSLILLVCLTFELLSYHSFAACSGISVYNIRDYGAKGDGKTIDTKAINDAIAKAYENGGGTVYFPPGTYVSASVHLKSNITIYLGAGSVIEAADDSLAKYDLPEPNEAGDHYQDFGHSHWQNSLIWGIGLENISIIGPGLIYGKGLNPGYHASTKPGGGLIYTDGGPGTGNKAIALRDCRNVILRDFSILHGGHFGILATGVSNLTIDNLKIDTNRDGMDVDACNNVRISNCSVNSPWDDAICLKASYGLGKITHCQNITISDCYVAGNFDEGTMLDGTFTHNGKNTGAKNIGRIKFGTESNGDFKNITITNCVFDECWGLAIESVDGSHIEDVSVSNITMRNIFTCPVFIRLGNRARGPHNPTVGTIRRININNVVVSGVKGNTASIISGIPDHPIEDLAISNIMINTEGGGTIEDADIFPPEKERNYPDPDMFGTLPAYGFFIRHVNGIEISHAKIDYNSPEYRPAFVLEDVNDAGFDFINAQQGTDNASYFDLRNVSGIRIKDSENITDIRLVNEIKRQEF
ncbi:MAG TPA: glycoside hydrolase family 28 protein [Bacteroidales bacterium]|nr:glycoside hydrolase family 28 protein [Bacteroidales bacterium]